MGRVEHNIGKKALTPEDMEYRALTLRTLGWLLLVFDGIIGVFVFVGIRDGSLLWFYWTVIEGVVGAALVLAGLRREENANRALAHSVMPHLEATEDVEHRNAA